MIRDRIQSSNGSSLNGLEAIQFLRARTLKRGFWTYWNWIERSIGWGSVLWLVGWAVFVAISGAEMLPRLKNPISSSSFPLAFSVGAFALLLWSVIRASAPPVYLNRQDLYRIGLAPIDGARALAWPLWSARGLWFAFGLVLGGIWSLAANTWFATFAPFAAPALGFILAAQVDLEWLSYTSRDGGKARVWLIGLIVGILALAVIGMFSSVGLASGLWTGSPFVLLAPAGMAFAAWLGTQSTLGETYPPKFAIHSAALAQLRALNAQLLFGWRPDPDQVRRFKAQLRQSTSSTRPTRFLPAPDARYGAAGMLAWRTALAILRRPVADQIVLVLQLVLVAATGSSLVRGTGGLAIQILPLMALLGSLIGPEFSRRFVPVGGQARTIGRTIVGLALIAVTGLISGLILPFIFGPNSLELIVLTVTRAALALVLLEKFSAWFRVPTSSTEARAGGALIAGLPMLIADAFGYGSSVIAIQVGLLFVLVSIND
jgi:hypothetical protein